MGTTIYLACLSATYVPKDEAFERVRALLREQDIVGEPLPPGASAHGPSFGPGPKAFALVPAPGLGTNLPPFERLTLARLDEPVFLPQVLNERFRLFCKDCKQEMPAQVLVDELDRVAYTGAPYQALRCPNCGAENPLSGLRSTVAMGLSRFFLEIAGCQSQQLNGGLLARLDALAGRPLGVLFEQTRDET